MESARTVLPTDTSGKVHRVLVCRRAAEEDRRVSNANFRCEIFLVYTQQGNSVRVSCEQRSLLLEYLDASCPPVSNPSSVPTRITNRPQLHPVQAQTTNTNNHSFMILFLKAWLHCLTLTSDTSVDSVSHPSSNTCIGLTDESR